ncbi:MAG: NADH-quinone oxidoreductase subunit L [Dehalococcoidia bacterium]|nr:NADH-quinone oxidoreductase subunit L [Dehalococcoidia bacterium]
MLNEQMIWSIFFLPLASFIIIALIVRPFLNKYSFISGPIAIISIGLSFLLSILAFIDVMFNKEKDLVSEPSKWLEIGNFEFTIGILMDPLTAIMLVTVTGVSLMVQIYSTGYMKNPISHTEDSTHDGPVELGIPVYARYFAYMSLFTASMLGLVMAANIVQLFIFWELVGLCSYLLIGFWFHKPSAANAAKKAFLVTRVGDVGFLIGILYLFYKTAGSETGNFLNISTINNYLPVEIGITSITIITILLFIGAIGKSGQFPLHTWLPDAMEGPTPVSALIHAATMVTAGVFLVARFFPIFESSETTMTIVALVGGGTAIFAASMGLVANDIKRVLAYSTVSQLGYMMLALGVGAYGAAIFHLFTHAFFKALLFLGSGSVNHATGTFDMRFMGGLKHKMPITYVTFLIGSLSLAGIFPLSGFWSKDEILLNAFKSNDPVATLVFILAIIAVFMTAFYMFRALYMTFEGDFRGGSDKDPDAHPHGPVHLAESPLSMTIPMVILTIPAVIIGLISSAPYNILGLTAHWLPKKLGYALPDGVYYYVDGAKDFNVLIAIFSSLIAISGIALAIALYKPNPKLSFKYLDKFDQVHRILINKFYIDELYEGILVKKAYYNGIASVSNWFDKYIVDTIAVISGWIAINIGTLLRQFQNGQTQTYATVTSLGIIAILIVFIFGN